MSRSYRQAAIALALTAAFSAPAALAADAPTDNAMRAAIDRDTGQLRAATAQEAAELARLERRQGREAARSGGLPPAPATETEALQTRQVYPGGLTRFEVPESLYSSVQAETGADGRVRLSHGEVHQAGQEVRDDR